jgi:peptidoglycan-associated lipoprotein
MMNRWVGGVVVVAAVAFALAGCSGKKKGAGLEDDGAGLGEEALPGAHGGSLDLAKAGTLGAQGGDTGPLRDVFFDYDSFDLDDASRQTLQENAEWLKDNSSVRVEIEGHCDDRGTVEYNLALGAKRAAAAKSYLSALGVGRDRLTTISYGEELPLCHEESESCWSRNRRAHFVPITE